MARTRVKNYRYFTRLLLWLLSGLEIYEKYCNLHHKNIYHLLLIKSLIRNWKYINMWCLLSWIKLSLTIIIVFLVNSFWDGPAVFTNLVEIKDLFIKVEISHIVPTPLVKTKPHNNNSFFGKQFLRRSGCIYKFSGN